MNPNYDILAGTDASLATLPSVQEKQVRVKKNAEFIMARNDSIAPAKALHMARALEFSFDEKLREKRAPLKALSLIPMDMRVPEGALTYKITRQRHQGAARYHRGNSGDTPRVGTSADEELRPVRHVVTMIEMDFFEEAASNFAGASLQGEMSYAANRVMEEFLNGKVWLGDTANDVYGVLNYPYVPKTVSAVTIDTVTAADTILAELHRLANNASEVSETVFSPNTLLLPTKKYNILSTRKRSATTDQTILQAFLQDNPFIDAVEVVPELAGQGISGAEDAMIMYRRNDSDSIANVVPKGVTMLPMQVDNFSTKIPVYMTHGGVIMRDALNNLVIYSPAS